MRLVRRPARGTGGTHASRRPATVIRVLDDEHHSAELRLRSGPARRTVTGCRPGPDTLPRSRQWQHSAEVPHASPRSCGAPRLVPVYPTNPGLEIAARVLDTYSALELDLHHRRRCSSPMPRPPISWRAPISRPLASAARTRPRMTTGRRRRHRAGRRACSAGLRRIGARRRSRSAASPCPKGTPPPGRVPPPRPSFTRTTDTRATRLARPPTLRVPPQTPAPPTTEDC